MTNKFENDIWVDKNVKAVSDKLKSRMEVGFTKYGCTTERTDLNLEQWLTHLSEELLDSSVYLERIMQEIKSKKSIGDSYDIIKDEINSDADLAYAWFCNIAVPMQDEGFDKYSSQLAAYRIMRNLFDVDMTKNKFYIDWMYRYNKEKNKE